jgi:hypothetical protein
MGEPGEGGEVGLELVHPPRADERGGNPWLSLDPGQRDRGRADSPGQVVFWSFPFHCQAAVGPSLIRGLGRSLG